MNVRAFEYERGIQRHKVIVDDALSAEQRTEQNRLQKQYRQMFYSIRPKIESVFAAQGEARPTAFRNVIARLENLENGLIWSIGKLLYDRAVETNVSESTIKEFLAVCAPFRALIYAMLLSWYDLSVRDTCAGEHFGAGRNDLFMAVYLPYCVQFVTAEIRGEQARCLREVGAAANLATNIMSYDDFCDSLLVRV